MQRSRQQNSSAEAALRRELHARCLRYRIQVPVLSKPRRVADAVLGALRVAVFVDGCLWRGCPHQAMWPMKHIKFWRAKLQANVARDQDTEGREGGHGWKVNWVWVNEKPEFFAGRVGHILNRSCERMRRP